jgi:4'-phosphopantetheinyl transferase
MDGVVALALGGLRSWQVPERTASVGWLLEIAADVPPEDTWLVERERVVLSGLRVVKRRDDWRLGRWTAKRAVARAVGLRAAMISRHEVSFDPGRLEIRAASGGAPEALLDGRPAPVAISISHAAGRGLCVVAPADVVVGCDVERIEPRSAAFVADYFDSRERALVEDAPAADRARLATLLWSAKESALKALGEGLRFDTRSVAVRAEVDPHGPAWRALAAHHHDSGRGFAGWWREVDGLILTLLAWPRIDEPVELA